MENCLPNCLQGPLKCIFTCWKAAKTKNNLYNAKLPSKLSSGPLNMYNYLFEAAKDDKELLEWKLTF